MLDGTGSKRPTLPFIQVTRRFKKTGRWFYPCKGKYRGCRKLGKKCTYLSAGIEKYSPDKCNYSAQRYKRSVFQKLKNGYKEDVAAANIFRDRIIERFNCKSQGDRLCQ
jgi:hypothetical protein